MAINTFCERVSRELGKLSRIDTLNDDRKTAIAVHAFPEHKGPEKIGFTLCPLIEIRVSRIIGNIVDLLQQNVAFADCRPSQVMSGILFPVNAVVLVVVGIPAAVAFSPVCTLFSLIAGTSQR